MIQNPVIRQQQDNPNPGPRSRGSVKWFDEKKGYGFIVCTEADKDVFIHHSQIKAEGFRTLNPGEEVEFELTHDRRGYRALNLTRVSKGD